MTDSTTNPATATTTALAGTGVPMATPTTSIASTGAPVMYSLGMIAATMEDFSGRNVTKYIEKLEQRARLDAWTEEETLNLLKYKCVDAAYDFLKFDSTLDTLKLKALKARLIEKFSPTRLPGDAQFQLSKYYQRHDETVTSFCTRLKMLGARVLEEDLSEATVSESEGIRNKDQALLLNQFKLGLRRDIMKEVGVLLLREQDLTLEKAKEIIKYHETTQMFMQLRHGTPSRVMQIRCYGCGEVGHVAKDCGRRQTKREI